MRYPMLKYTVRLTVHAELTKEQVERAVRKSLFASPYSKGKVVSVKVTRPAKLSLDMLPEA